MKLSVDISLYPLKDDYIPAIQEFISRLESSQPNESNKNIKIVKNNLSTQIFGDYDEVMNLLQAEFRRHYEKFGKGIFVTKFLMGDLS